MEMRTDMSATQMLYKYSYVKTFQIITFSGLENAYAIQIATEYLKTKKKEGSSDK